MYPLDLGTWILFTRFWFWTMIRRISTACADRGKDTMTRLLVGERVPFFSPFTREPPKPKRAWNEFLIFIITSFDFFVSSDEQ